MRLAGAATRKAAREALAAGRTVTGMKNGKIVEYRLADASDVVEIKEIADTGNNDGATLVRVKLDDL